MLKIKDNVPLEKLEEYGFKEELDCYKRYTKEKIDCENEPYSVTTFIIKNNKQIMNLISNSYTDFFSNEIGLEDIKKLVEKVDE